MLIRKQIYSFLNGSPNKAKIARGVPLLRRRSISRSNARHTRKLTPIILLLTAAACRLIYVIDPKMEYSPVQIVICSAGSAPDKILTASPCIINLLFIFLFFPHIFTSVLVYITYHSIHKHCRKREENNNKGITKKCALPHTFLL